MEHEPILTRDTTVGVVGAGAMGHGIAQVAALYGHPVVLVDTNHEAMARARASIQRSLARDVEKERRTREDADGALRRIKFVEGIVGHDLEALGPCGLVIEAVPERLELKQQIFRGLEAVVEPGCVLATNTSSLSVSTIASVCRVSERVLGVHFFNPAPVMPLVEVIPAIQTDPAVTSAACALVDAWGKTTVLASDTPGFIVNRVARPFYGEALRMLEEGIADAATIDWAMRELGGFRMGPFELMDFIGNDVNYAVTRTVWESLFYDPRYKPALTQKRLAESGFLGRKSGRGYYDYRDGAERPAPTEDRALGHRILDRILAMLINEAVDAVYLGIASPADVDLAMTRGVNYPTGLLRWGDEIGLDVVLSRLEALREEYAEDRYRPSPLLRRMVREGRTFNG